MPAFLCCRPSSFIVNFIFLWNTKLYKVTIAVRVKIKKKCIICSEIRRKVVEFPLQTRRTRIQYNEISRLTKNKNTTKMKKVLSSDSHFDTQSLYQNLLQKILIKSERRDQLLSKQILKLIEHVCYSVRY